MSNVKIHFSAEVEGEQIEAKMSSQNYAQAGLMALDLLEMEQKRLAQLLYSDKAESLLKSGVTVAEQLSQEINDSLYHCGCGKSFPTQNGYAGHQNHCNSVNK